MGRGNPVYIPISTPPSTPGSLGSVVPVGSGGSPGSPPSPLLLPISSSILSHPLPPSEAMEGADREFSSINNNLINASSVLPIVTHNIPYISSVHSARAGRASSTGGDVRKHILKAGPIRRTVGQRIFFAIHLVHCFAVCFTH